MATLLNNLQVNVLDSNYNAYLQYYDNNLSLVNTEAEGVYFNKDMSYTFANCKNMYMNMDDTWYGYYAKVENMSHTYYECQNIRGSVTVRQNVINANSMCYNCFRLDGTVQLGPNVVDFNRMYQRCSNVTGLNIKTQNAAHIYNKLFAEYDATNTNNTLNKTSILNMRNIYFGPQVVNAEFAFDNCYTYKGYVPKMGTSIINAKNCFRNVNLMLGSPDTGDSVVDAYGMFANCQNLSGDARVGNNVINAAFIFNCCVNLSGNVWFSNSVQNYAYACNNCPNIRGGITIGRNAVNLYNAFMNMGLAIGQLKAPDRLPNLVNCVNAFYADGNLTGNVFNTMNVNNGFQTFKGCKGLQGEARVGQNLKNGAYMFHQVNLDSITYGTNFGKNLINAYDMFGYTPKNAEKMIRSKAMMPYINANAQNYSYMYAYANFQEIDSTIVAQNYSNINKINMASMFYNSPYATGTMFIPNAANVYSMYGNDVSLNQVRWDRRYCNDYNKFQYVAGYSNTFKNIKNVYISDNVYNFYYAMSNGSGNQLNIFNNMEIKTEPGWQMNNLDNMAIGFYGLKLLKGNIYAPRNVNNMYYTYYNCDNADGTYFFNSKVITSSSYRYNSSHNLCSSVHNCKNLTGIYYDAARPIYGWFGESFGLFGQYNTFNENTFPYYNRINKITIGPNVTNLYYTFYGYAPIRYYNVNNNTWYNTTSFVGDRMGAHPTVQGGQNVVNMYYAFGYRFDIASGVCGDKVTNAACAYYDCYNLGSLPVVGNNVVNGAQMYGYCTNAGRNSENREIRIPNTLKNVYGMFRNIGTSSKTKLYVNTNDLLNINIGPNSFNYFLCNANVGDEQEFVIPQGSGYGIVNSYYNVFGERNLYIAGMPGAMYFIRDMHYNDALAGNAGLNIHNVYVMNTCPWNNLSFFHFVNGMQNLYVNCNNATYMLMYNNNVSFDVTNVHWQNFNNLQNIEIQNNVMNAAFFMSNKNSTFFRNVRKIHFQGQGNRTNGYYFAYNCPGLGYDNGGKVNITFENKSIYEASYMFFNCTNLSLNIQETGFANNLTANCYDTWYNTKITGNAQIPDAKNVAFCYQNCRFVTGNNFSTRNALNVQGTWYGCENITGDVHIQNVAKNIAYICYNCSNIENAYVGHNAELFNYAFNNCTNLKHVEFNNVRLVYNRTNIYNMFQNCPNLNFVISEQNIPFLYAARPANGDWACYGNASYAFYNCGNISGCAVLPGAIAGNVTSSYDPLYNMYRMYYNCKNFNQMYITGMAGCNCNNGSDNCFDNIFGVGMYDYKNKTEKLTIDIPNGLYTTYNSNYFNATFAKFKNLKEFHYKVNGDPYYTGATAIYLMRRFFSLGGMGNCNYTGVDNFNNMKVIDITAKNWYKAFDGINGLPNNLVLNLNIFVNNDNTANLACMFSATNIQSHNLNQGRKLHLFNIPAGKIENMYFCVRDCEDVGYQFTDPNNTYVGQLYGATRNSGITDYTFPYGGNNATYATEWLHQLKNVNIRMYNYSQGCIYRAENIERINVWPSNYWSSTLWTANSNTSYISWWDYITAGSGNSMLNHLKEINFAYGWQEMNKLFFNAGRNSTVANHCNTIVNANMPNMPRGLTNGYFMFHATQGWSMQNINWNLPYLQNSYWAWVGGCNVSGDIYVNTSWNGFRGSFPIAAKYYANGTVVNRNASSPRFNIHIRRESAPDKDVQNTWSSELGTYLFGEWNGSHWGHCGKGQLVDNGWFFPNINVYIYNNLT